jgi:hypothetical protein
MSPAADFTETPSKMLAKSLYSFKVLTECPIIVVLLFQSHRKFASDNIVKFVPLIIDVSSRDLNVSDKSPSYLRAIVRHWDFKLDRN